MCDGHLSDENDGNAKEDALIARVLDFECRHEPILHPIHKKFSIHCVMIVFDAVIHRILCPEDHLGRRMSAGFPLTNTMSHSIGVGATKEPVPADCMHQNH